MAITLATVYDECGEVGNKLCATSRNIQRFIFITLCMYENGMECVSEFTARYDICRLQWTVSTCWPRQGAIPVWDTAAGPPSPDAWCTDHHRRKDSRYNTVSSSEQKSSFYVMQQLQRWVICAGLVRCCVWSCTTSHTQSLLWFRRKICIRVCLQELSCIVGWHSKDEGAFIQCSETGIRTTAGCEGRISLLLYVWLLRFAASGKEPQWDVWYLFPDTRPCQVSVFVNRQWAHVMICPFIDVQNPVSYSAGNWVYEWGRWWMCKWSVHAFCNITCMTIIVIILVCSYSGVSTHSFTCSVTMKLIRQKLPIRQALRQVMIIDLQVSIISLLLIGLYCEGTKAGLGRMAPQWSTGTGSSVQPGTPAVVIDDNHWNTYYMTITGKPTVESQWQSLMIHTVKYCTSERTHRKNDYCLVLENEATTSSGINLLYFKTHPSLMSCTSTRAMFSESCSPQCSLPSNLRASFSSIEAKLPLLTL